MGDAGSRALGYFIGVGVMISGNPFIILATSSIIMIDTSTILIINICFLYFEVTNFISNGANMYIKNNIK